MTTQRKPAGESPAGSQNRSATTTTKDTRLPTQRDRILALLRSEEAVCGTTMLASAMPRYAAVIHRLRSDGWYIVTRPCSRPWHSHRSPQVEYAMAGEE